MAAATIIHPKPKSKITVIKRYDVAADAKKRISLRGAKTKYFRVQELSNGSFLLEPQVLMPLDKVSARSLKTLEASVANLKKGTVSPPIDLSQFLQD